ncbi:MAG: chromosome segregation protein SMC [Clostridia bacterium]|nr:chromosome segregation protein SMC [Clostridia bacterium]
MAYLKNLEISGFKSFPDKVNIAFTDGICAIVGPNGSGKSNICDAVRWVFGEQSAKTLRGDRMEDVIFGGTEKRRPTGFAEVTLTLDNSSGIFNSDYSEVAVTRRYFRSGESEYFINRAQVRLKDVHELFMDTGLGRDGYSIIGQGRIAEILSQKSSDRRQIFEEAAGISKYRYRKLESERKLKSTEENLARLSDIIALLSEREKTLAGQAKKAREYLSLRDSLRELEVTLFIRASESAKENTEKLEGQIADVCAELSEKKKEENETDARIESLNDRMREADIAINTSRTELGELKLKIQSAQSDAAAMEGTLSRNIADIERLTNKGGAGRERLLQNDALIGEAKARIAQLSEAHEKSAQALSAISRESGELSENTKNKLAELEALRAQAESESARMARLREEASSLSSAVSLRRSQQSGRDKTLSALGEKLSAISKDIEKNRSEAEKIGAARALKSKLFEDENARLLKIEEEIRASQARINDMERRGAAARARLNTLTELQRELEGFSGSVKFVMHSAREGRLSGIEGTVANLITVEEKYAAAVETALGGAAGNIVTDGEDAAKAAIMLLKETKKGRATFLPLTAVKGQRHDFSALSRRRGFISCAFDVISCDKKYDGIFLYLLGRTALFSDLDTAVEAAKATGYKTRIVTLDGQTINAGGSLTGGSLSKNAGVVMRTAQMARLGAECEENEKAINGEKEKLAAKTKSLSGIKSRAQAAQSEARAYDAALSEKNSEHEFLKRAYSEAREAYRTAESETEDASKRMKTDEEAKAELEKSIEEGAARLTELKERLFSMETEYKSLLLEQRAAEAALSEARLSFELGGRDLDAARARLLSYEQKSGEINEENTALKDEAQSLKAENEELKVKIEKAKDDAERMKTKLSKDEAALSKMTAEKLVMEGESVSLLKAQRELSKKTGELEREQFRLETKLETARTRIEEMAAKLWDAYELTPETARKYLLGDEVSSTRAQSAAAELKRKIGALGSINTDAIEEYAEVKEKLDFLKLQTDDLVKAKNSLENIVSSLTRRMREIFTEQFGEINKHFSQTFSELFGGGRAWLELEDENDVLNCGIEIHVQPPGKNLKSITLLSGGEQAFTAIAVLFAMMKIRPAPFCVLDEVEAALDEVNVLRFGRYIESFKDKTQFVVITHRRGTMEFADMLYGVTMQEKGVSKLISINVRDAAKQMNILR